MTAGIYSMNWGIIGPGGIAHQFTEALIPSTQGKLYAVASRDLVRAQTFAKQYSVPQCYGNYGQLIGDDQVDIIYIATPHAQHFQYAKACLQAGKHVLLEKPVTVNAAQTMQLVILAQQQGCVFQEALWSRFMPCFAEVKNWLDSGEIGEVQYICSQIGFAFSHLRDHRLTNPALAGGALLDLGIYSVSLSQFLLAEYPQQVQATALINEDKVDQNTLVNLQYPSGIFSQFTSTIGAHCSNVMSIHGTKGFVHLPSYFWNGKQADLYKDGKLVRSQLFPHQINGFEYQIQSVMDSISAGRLCDPNMNHQDSINVMETLDHVRKQIGLQFPDEIEALC
jgi:predicted dehydrogenase